MRLLLTTVTLLFTFSLVAQSKKEQAHKLTFEAVQKMDAGKIDESIVLLKKAKKLDPDGMNPIYEMGYAYTMKGEYAKSIKMYQSILDHEDVSDRVYVMLGNAYDYDGKREEAIQTYEDGLEKFPKSGALHLERGNMYLQQEDYSNAMFYYEKGIEVEPTYTSNYYRAANIYFLTDQEIWGMMYAELHILLSPGSERSIELSKKLYDCYKDNITATSDTSMQIDLCESILTIDNISDVENLKMPYCTSWGTAMSLAALQFSDALDIEDIARIRSSFVKNYFSMGYGESLPNVLYDYRKKIADEDLDRIYNYYIVMMGEPDFAREYFEANEAELDKLSQFLYSEPINISEDNKLYRKQYAGE